MLVFTILFVILIQAAWFFLTKLLRTYKLNRLLFYISLVFLVLIMYSLTKQINLLAFIIFGFILIWSFWRIFYITYRLTKSEQQIFFIEDYDFKRQLLFQKKSSLILSLAILPILMAFLFGTKDFDYLGIANFLLFIGSLIWILGFLIEILFVGQKLGLQDFADSDIWAKDGVWNFAKLKRKFADIFIWIGIAILTLTIFF